MPMLKLAAIKDERSTAVDALHLALKLNPRLKALGTTFRDWSGGPADTDPPAAAELPLVTLSPTGGESGWHHVQEHFSHIDVAVEGVIEGTDLREGLKFWRCLERAIFPDDGAAAEAVHAKLRAAGISGVEIVKSAAMEYDRADATGRLYVSGVVRLLVYIPTSTHA